MISKNTVSQSHRNNKAVRNSNIQNLLNMERLARLRKDTEESTNSQIPEPGSKLEINEGTTLVTNH